MTTDADKAKISDLEDLWLDANKRAVAAEAYVAELREQMVVREKAAEAALAEAHEQLRRERVGAEGDQRHANRLSAQLEAAEQRANDLQKELEWVGALNKANIENGDQLRTERDLMKTQRDAYIARVDELADALREIANAHSAVATRPIARAALDRQEQR